MLIGDLDKNAARRNLQIATAAHIRVQEEIDHLADEVRLPEPASRAFIRWLHTEFRRDATESVRLVKSDRTESHVVPGEWRKQPDHDGVVGGHVPPSSGGVEPFMKHFAWRYRREGMGCTARIQAMAAAHHRLNYIHPVLDGNGRASRLMSHAMAQYAGIGARGPWSVSRSLARCTCRLLALVSERMRRPGDFHGGTP